jgi:hypothetical protein
MMRTFPRRHDAIAMSFLLVLGACAHSEHVANPAPAPEEAEATPAPTPPPPAPQPQPIAINVVPAPAPAPTEQKQAPTKKVTAADRAAAFAPLDLPTPNTWRLADGSPGPDYWQQQADYVISAELDPEAHELHGKATVTYTNNSPQDLDFIWLHLEQNLFKDDSLGTLSSVPGARFSNRPEFQGGVKIASLSAGGKELAYTVYDTLARVDLPAPIPHRERGGSAGGKFTFDVEWSFTIPDYGVDRMGIEKAEQGDIFEIAQWFPAVAVYDDVHGWNTLPYLGQGEFYTNFGDYDVKITVPRSHLVAATGELQNPSEVLTPTQVERLGKARKTAETVMIRSADEVADAATRPSGDGPLTWHFKAHNVRTFAFASSASFIWDAAAVDGNADASGTLAQSMYAKEAQKVWSQSTDMLRFSIEDYTKRWFKYPYPIATNICGCVGGMEYPMIIFCGGSGSERGLYGVTTHEIGHNWFPMTVNTDERRHAWMDEGFNTFINIYSEADRFNDGKVRRRGRASTWLLRPGLPPMDTPPDEYGPGLLGELAYAKPGEALFLLREVVLGPERFDRAFREYIRRWAFKSPRPADFYRTMENVSGVNLDWFWRGWITEDRSLDQGVEAVEQRTDMESATVTLENVGDMVMPVSFRVTLEDGSTVDRSLPVEVWCWTSHWKTDVPTNGKKVVSVRLDPEGMMPDVNRKNNEWKAPEKPEAAPGAPADQGAAATTDPKAAPAQ